MKFNLLDGGEEETHNGLSFKGVSEIFAMLDIFFFSLQRYVSD